MRDNGAYFGKRAARKQGEVEKMQQAMTTRVVEAEIRQLCLRGLDSVTLRRGVMQQLRKVVPFDACCWGAIDPDTLLITSEVSEGIPNFAFAPVAENEYLIEDVNKFSFLARNSTPVGILSQSTVDTPALSTRFRTVLTQAGFAYELRAAFVANQRCWGGVTLLRHEHSHDFTAAEGRLLARLSAVLADGFRMAILVDRSPVTVSGLGPGLIVLDEQRKVQAINGSAQAWLAELVEPGAAVEPTRLPAPIYEVAMRAQAIAQVAAQGNFAAPLQAHLRLRTRAGQWLTVHGSHMFNPEAGTVTATGQTAIILEVAQSSEIAQFLMLVYDLTPREREVLQLVLKGLVVKEMAVALQVSIYTVQDYLKALFGKVGVHSRGELVARVLGEHYFPLVGPR